MKRILHSGIWRFLTAAAIALVMQPTLASQPRTLNDHIDDFVRAEMRRQHIPGVAVAVIQHGAVVHAQGYGKANIELGVPVTTETVFQSASLGKHFTAAAILLQIEDGKLSLSDPITRFFPEAPKNWGTITVYHLLTHTSGIPDYAGLVDLRHDYTEDDIARLTWAQPLEFAPGARWSYCNTGYVLLGAIVRKVSGTSYGDVLAQRVFKPLGMSTARVASQADIVPNRAAGYRLDGGTLKNAEWVAPTLAALADGGLMFSLRDLIAWDGAMRARALLTPKSWDQMLQPVRLTSGATWPYGFGWFLKERGGAPLQEHEGTAPGVRTLLSRFAGDDLSIIVLTNLSEAEPERFINGIISLINPALSACQGATAEDC